MTKHLRGIFLLSVLSIALSNCSDDPASTNNVATNNVSNDTGSNNMNDVGGNDVGVNNDTSADVTPECVDGSGCDSGVCDAGVCQDATCDDTVKNGDESDADCGGSCAPCTNGMACGENADCDGGACTNDVCQPVSCADGLKNGNETDLDCGGDCMPCTPGLVCAENADCDSAVCTAMVCVASVCGDNTVNGAEACDEGAVDTATCNSDCTAAVCGDSIINAVASETCDDGNMVTEACAYGLTDCMVCADDCTTQVGATSLCGDANIDANNEVCDDGTNDGTPGSCLADCSAAVVCGDSVVAGTEVCDDGTNDGTPGSCLADCSAAVVCGDNVVAGTEVCDDGNTVTEVCLYGAMSCTVCDAVCASIPGVTSYCGDSATDVGNNEQCDDGNADDADDCSNTCQFGFKRVFTTSQTTPGDFGGLAGGDLHCQTLADAAGLGGTYMAWISDSTGSPSTRFTQSPGPYKLVDGTLIANDWNDLTDGTIANPINITELGGTPPDGSANICGDTRTVWSNTRANGTMLSANLHCSDWTGTGGSAWGRWHQVSDQWTQWCSGGLCTGVWVANLYCFEQ